MQISGSEKRFDVILIRTYGGKFWTIVIKAEMTKQMTRYEKASHLKAEDFKQIIGVKKETY